MFCQQQSPFVHIPNTWHRHYARLRRPAWLGNGRKEHSRGGRPTAQKQIPSPLVARPNIRFAVKHSKTRHKFLFDGIKAALMKVAKKHRTEHFEPELQHATSDLRQLRADLESALD
jgi:hypothetical protein